MKNATIDSLLNLFPFNVVEIYLRDCGYCVGNCDELKLMDECERPVQLRSSFDVHHFALGDNTVVAYV